MTSSDPQISASLADGSEQKRERPPTSFWLFLAFNGLGASVASYAARTLDSAPARASDSGPGGGLVMLFFISLPVAACLLASLIALAIAVAATIKRPRFAPAMRLAAIIFPWLVAFTVGPLSR